MMPWPRTYPAIFIDEVGIAAARHGGLVLKSAFQLVFRPHGGALRAVAAQSYLRPFMKGLPVPPGSLFAALDADERLAVERLAVAIHLSNHRQIGVEGLPHMLGLGPALAVWPGTADLLADRAGGEEEPPPVLICSLRGPAGIDDTLAAALVAQDAQLALGGAAGDAPPLDTIRRLTPSIVRIDGAWFRRVACDAGALRLLGSLVEGFKELGARVLVEGIETRQQLAAALDLKADLLQGFLLSQPQLAGTVVERTVLPLPKILPAPASVIQLFGGR